MKQLKSKTFFTLFFIFSAFLITILLIFNIQNYSREYSEIKSNLTRLNGVIVRDNKKIPRNNPVGEVPPMSDEDKSNKEDLDRRIIMDYEVYTFLLNSDNSIMTMINHSDNEDDSDITDTANDIISSDKDGMVIDLLYFSDYSYNYRKGESLVIVKTDGARKRLLKNLYLSLGILVLFEIIIFFLSKLITKWLTKPALDSYQKQKNFIADASHELKTPVAVIMASADALESDMNEKKWLNNIKQETEKMSNLITNLLNLSKLENETDKSMYSMNDISKIINKCILTFDSLAFENKIKLTDQIEDNIMFNCNSLEMNELASILIDNAIKHADAKSSIIVSLATKGDEIILSVSNKGEEIPESDYDKIFERFYRVDESHNRNANRYGLGLAIAKSIVINHGGKISVKSEDHLTTFKVIFKK